LAVDHFDGGLELFRGIEKGWEGSPVDEVLGGFEVDDRVVGVAVAVEAGFIPRKFSELFGLSLTG